jgi:acyl-CoA reductase-like NAD-dependent aldehyde dehydrogenase
MNPSVASNSRSYAFGDPKADVTEFVANAISIVRSAQPRWAQASVAQRLEFIRELRRLIVENAAHLAEASAAGRSRPMLESLTAEVLPLVEACRFLEREAERILRSVYVGRRGLPLWLMGVRSEILREAFGVVLVIGPGNYPLLLPGVQLIQALVAGNAVLLKPGLGGTAAATALCQSVLQAGLDPQLVVLLPESPEAARAAIAARPDKVLFTGSAATGEQILGQLASHLIPATMELSGCDAALIRADADLDLAAKALAFGLRLNNGATCMSPKRVFVARSIAGKFESQLIRALNASVVRKSEDQELTPGNAGLLKPGTNWKLFALLEDALADGARIIAGGIEESGMIRTPLVIAGLSPNAKLLQEDLFVPVLSILTVVDDEEAVVRINSCPFALTASIFTRDVVTARSLAPRLNVGVLTINDLIVPTADARLPFGGRKRSGFGVTRGGEGLLELTAPKVVTESRGKFRPAYEAPKPGDAKMFQAYLAFSHGRGLKTRLAALISLVHSVFVRRNS